MLLFALLTGGGWRQPKRVFLENGAFWGSDCVFLEKYAFRRVVTPPIREIRIPMSQNAYFSWNTQSDEPDWLWLGYNAWRQVVKRFTAATVKIPRSLQTCSRTARPIFDLRHLSTQTRFGLQRQFESRFAVYFFFLHTSRLKRVFALLSATKRDKTRQILILHKRRHAFHSNERQSEPSWPEPKCVAVEKYAIWPMCQNRRQTFNPRNTQSSFWRFSLLLIFTTNLPSRNQNIENLSCFINKKWRQDAKTL